MRTGPLDERDARVKAAFVVAAAFILLACTAEFPRPAGALEFQDADWRRGELLGHVVFEPSAGDTTPTYHLYLGLSATRKYTDVPLAIWADRPNRWPRYTHVVSGPVPKHASHWLLFPVNAEGNDAGPPLALPIEDRARASLPYELLNVNGRLRDAPAPVAVYRSGEELAAGGEAFRKYIAERVDFAHGSVLHVWLHTACPGDWGIRFLGLSRSEGRLNVHVHVWSTNELQAACSSSFWIATERIAEETTVEVVPFSRCVHPMYDCDASAGTRLDW